MSTLSNLESVFVAMHETQSVQARLSVFMKQLSSDSYRGSLKIQQIDTVVHSVVFQALQYSSSLTLEGGKTEQLSSQGTGMCGGTMEPAPPIGEEVAEQCREMDSLLRRVAGARAPSSNGEARMQDLTASDATSMVSLLFVLGREAGRRLEWKVQRLNSELKGLLEMSEVPASLGRLVTLELQALGQAQQLTVLCLAQQSFSVDQQRLLGSLLSSRPELRYIDLTGCLLKDTFVRNTLIPSVGALNHLCVLLLKENALTDSTALSLLEVLQDTAKAPKLQVCNLSSNDISLSFLAQIGDSIQLRRKRCIVAASTLKGTKPQFLAELLRGTATVSVGCFDGGAMMTVVQALYLNQCAEALELQPSTCKKASEMNPFMVDWTDVKCFVGTSFGAIVAAALVHGKTPDEILKFYSYLAETVFEQGHYTYYMQTAGRMVRDWWTGGNYYSATSFREGLAKLFGARTALSATPPGKDLILIALQQEGTGQTPAGQHQCTLFRSYDPDDDCLLVDALMACCAVNGFFAPVPLQQAPNRRNGNFVEAEFEPNPSRMALCELLQFVGFDRLQMVSVSAAVRSTCTGSADTAGRQQQQHSLNPLLVRAVTTKGIDLAAAGKLQRGTVATEAKEGPHAAGATLREIRLLTAAQTIADSVREVFDGLSFPVATNDEVREEAEGGETRQGSDLYHRLTLCCPSRVKMDEDSPFILIELLPQEVADSWVKRKQDL